MKYILEITWEPTDLRANKSFSWQLSDSICWGKVLRCGLKLLKQQVTQTPGWFVVCLQWVGSQYIISMILWLTGVGRKQGAALAVDDLLNKWHILGEGGGHHTEARHHWIQGGNSSHHAEVWIKIWKQKRNKNEIHGKEATPTQQRLNTDLFSTR